MTNELKKAIETVKEYLDMDSDVDSEYLNAQRTIIQALESQPTDAKQDCEHCIHTYGTLGCCDMVNNEWVYDCDFGKEQYKKEHEEQPTDAVSRQDVDAYIAKLMSGYLYDEERTRLEEFSAYLWELPPVTPRTNLAKTSQDCISRKAVRKLICQNNDYYGYSERFHDFTEKCLQLPPATPQRPTGKWEYVQYDGNPNIGNWHCSECNRIVCGAITAVNPVYAYKYCPNCGAEMSGGGEDDT